MYTDYYSVDYLLILTYILMKQVLLQNDLKILILDLKNAFFERDLHFLPQMY